MAGPSSHSQVGDGKNPSRHLRNHVLAPLLGRFDLGLFITCDELDVGGWKTYINPLYPYLFGWDLQPGTALPDIDQTRFKDGPCKIKGLRNSADHCRDYYLQYGHLLNSFNLMRNFELKHLLQFSYVIKARADLQYKPDNVFRPAWFEHLPERTVGATSTEFHMRDRWMEREPPLWPNGMSDQFVFGSRDTMKIYFDLFYSKREDHGWVEVIVAGHVQEMNLSVITVELQTSQAGGKKFVNGKDGVWVKTPCRLCFNPCRFRNPDFCDSSNNTVVFRSA
eukprot:gene30072-37548_t